MIINESNIGMKWILHCILKIVEPNILLIISYIWIYRNKTKCHNIQIYFHFSYLIILKVCYFNIINGAFFLKLEYGFNLFILPFSLSEFPSMIPDDRPAWRSFPELSLFSVAIAVFDAGRELWKYYHKQPECNVNASLYDIREHFQGRNEKGRMNTKSSDETYMNLIGILRDNLDELANKIEPKVYEYGFLIQ